MPSRWRVVYPSAFAQAWDCPGKCNSPGLHWYTAGGGRVVWRVGCGAGCAFVPRIYAHACHPPPPGPPGLRGGVSCARGVRGVVCGVPVLRGVSLYICTRLSPPPPVVGGVAGLPCAGWGWRGVWPYICTRRTPPPGKGIKRAGRPCCRPAFVGCAYFWLLFMPPRLRMVTSVSAISSGVYPAAANTAPSLSSSTAFVSIQ